MTPQQNTKALELLRQCQADGMGYSATFMLIHAALDCLYDDVVHFMAEHFEDD